MELKFIGEVTDGCGKFRHELLLPDASREHDDGWIGILEKGTFNIGLQNLNLHLSNDIVFGKGGVRALDLRDDFPPQIFLPSSVIPDNTIQPTDKIPLAGDLQFWRSLLSCQGKLSQKRCYMLRRVNSGPDNEMELVGEVRLRDDFMMVSGDKVEMSVFSKTVEKESGI